jgi:hypothetical protein
LFRSLEERICETVAGGTGPSFTLFLLKRGFKNGIENTNRVGVIVEKKLSFLIKADK